MESLQIGATLAYYRKQKQMTQQALADYLDLSKSSISKWENDLTFPDISLLPKLASLYHVTIDTLLNYSPNLTQSEINEYYQYFTKQFTQFSYEKVKEEVQCLLEKYPACYSLKLQMTLLMINHLNLITDSTVQQKEMRHLITWCAEVKKKAQTANLLGLANTTQALLYNSLGEFDETLMILGQDIPPYFSQASLLATAFAGKNEHKRAYEIQQVEVYQNLFGLLSNSGHYLKYLEENQVDETLRRIKVIIEAYDIKRLAPYGYLSFLLLAFSKYLQLHNIEKMVHVMRDIEELLRDSPAIQLVEDAYFDRILIWLERQVDIGSSTPRDKTFVKQSIQTFFLQHQQLVPTIEQNSEYLDLLEKINQHLEGV